MENKEKKYSALYYPESICLDETELKSMLLLYDKVFFLPSDIHLNPGHTNLSKRFSMFDSILAGAFKSQKEAHYYNMYGSESDVWDDTMKRLMDLYDELEERKQISVLQEDSFSNVWEWHPLQVAVDADMQDSDFVTLCQKYRNKKIFIPMINNAKIKGGGFIVRPSKFKEPYGIPSICAERMNAVLYLSGKYELFPVCGDKMYVDLLKAKLRRAAIASPKFATPPKNFHKFSMLSWEVATEVIPRVVIGSKSANEIIRYKEACLDAKQRFRSYLWRLEAATSSEAWDNKFTVELEKLIKMEIVPETQKIRDQKVEIWEKLFGDTLTSLTSAKVLPPLLGIHLVPGLSFWQILAFSSSTIAYATFKPLVDAWREERKLRRNALFFLLNLSK